MTTKTQQGIKLPDFTGRTHTIIGELIVFVSVQYDEGRPDPTEDDGVGKIIEFRRHTPQAEIERGNDALANDPDAVMLSCHEHGNVNWYVATGQADAWDGCVKAGVWIPDEAVREAYTPKIHGPDRRKWMVEQAESAVKQYTDWVNGSVFRYSVEVYAVRRDAKGQVYDLPSDYRREEPLEQESCSGFYGYDAEFEEEVRRSATAALEAAQKTLSR